MPAPRILFETPHLLALDKPAGLSVERDPHGHASLEQWVHDELSKRYRNPYVGIVHRLDRRVSGVMLVAKKRSALRKLNAQFAERRTTKIYHALVGQAPPKPAGRLQHYLDRDPRRKRAVAHAKKVAKTNKEAVLHYEILEQLPDGYLLEVRPVQGRFHQIRVQLAAAGCPIVGDELYGGRSWKHRDAIALHAAELRFRHPVTDKVLFARAPAPWLPNKR